MKYYISRKIEGKTFAEVEKLVREKIQEQGFGVITEIDVTQTFKNKLDIDFRPYKILGACNPKYAHAVLSKSDKVGVMLPCNVCVQQLDDKHVEVFAINPLEAMKSINEEGMENFAQEVYEHMNAVIENL